MKTMSPFPVLLLLFVLSFSVNPPPLSSAASAPKPVVDASGKIVRGGGISYQIWPVYPTTGGLQVESLDYDRPCPLDIVQEDEVPGLQVNFSPINEKKGVVRVSTDLNIQFPSGLIEKCPGSNHWWSVDAFPSTGGNYFLTTGGEKGNPGPKTIRNWFKIEEYGRPGEYKLLYCPTFCKSCNVSCKYVGIIVQDGKRRLGLTDVPMKFVLK